jgi:hypothetical protein
LRLVFSATETVLELDGAEQLLDEIEMSSAAHHKNQPQL